MQSNISLTKTEVFIFSKFYYIFAVIFITLLLLLKSFLVLQKFPTNKN